MIRCLSLSPASFTQPLTRLREPFCKLDQIVMNKGGWSFDELHFASESAVVPPIGHQRGNSVAPAFVVDFDDEKIAGVANEIGDLEIKWREAAFVLPDLLAVEINVCLVIRGAEIDEETRVWLALVIERFLVPDRAFVEEQLV